MATRLLTTSAEQILVRSNHRKSFTVSNEDPAIAIFIKRERTEILTVSSSDHDHRVGPGSSFSINAGTDGIQAAQDSWSAVAESGTPRISVVETEDIQR